MKKIFGYCVLFCLSGCIVIAPKNPVAPLAPSAPEQFAPKAQNMTVYFMEDQANLSSEAQAALKPIIANNTVLSPSIKVIGYADETGTREYNLALGAQRAAAVRDYLVANGVSNSRITIQTKGQEAPAVACGNQKCAPENRRVEIIIQS